MVNQYIFVKRQRVRKKMAIYKLLFSLSLDVTTLLYISILIGYVIFAIVRVGEVPPVVLKIFTQIRTNSQENLYQQLPFLLLPIFYFVRSFSHPGVLFSSGEYLLATLPNRREIIWFYSFLQKSLQQAFIIILFVSLLYWLTSYSYKQLLFYAVLLE